MRIKDYLHHSDRKLTENTRILKDSRVFEFNYIPEDPIMREEVKPIVDALLKFEKTGIPNNLIVYGARGCGKTLTIKYLQNLLEEKTGLTILYSNCRHLNTSYKIFANLIHTRARGLSLAEVFDQFCLKFKERVVVVLDEVDLMSEKDKNREILYLLSRHPNCYMVVLLSNNPKFLEELDSSTKSTLQPERIHFKTYDAVQITEILQQRARTGLQSHDRLSLHKISSLTYNNANSDIRVAIKTLYYWVTEPGNNITASFERARKDIFIDLIQNLNDKNLLILKALRHSHEGFVKPAYEVYKKLSIENRDKPYSYGYFYNNLSYLQSLGLILLLTAKVQRVYTNRAQLLFDETILDEVCRFRFGE